jgi:ribosome-associated protein
MDIRRKQRAAVEALEDVKGRDIVVFNTSRLSTIFERVIIASGDSTRHVKALADSVEDKLKALGARVFGVEGGAEAEWVLVDLGDIVVHVMHPTVRSYYNLEEIWGEKRVKLKRAAPEHAPGRERRAAATARRRAVARAKHG